MQSNILDHIKIASPCSADWNEMQGDNRQRYCSHCKLNVYNLSEMTQSEAENLLFEKEGNMCVRLYKRNDGTVITQDCPVGLAMIKRKISRAATAVFGLLAGLFGGVFAVSQISFDNSKLLEEVTVEKETLKTVTTTVPVSPKLKKEKKKKPNYQAVNGRISNIRDLQDEPVELWIK